MFILSYNMFNYIMFLIYLPVPKVDQNFVKITNLSIVMIENHKISKKVTKPLDSKCSDSATRWSRMMK